MDLLGTLGLFMKEPVAGRVKTRLGNEIGMDQSAELYAAFICDILSQTEQLNANRVLAYAPDKSAKRYFAAIQSDSDQLWLQPETDLGDRLSQFFQEHLRDQQPVVVIGSDSPSLPASYISKAFELLEQNDVVLGPAVDGGYYLVGQRRYVPELFEGIDWSQPEVLQQSVQQLARSNVSLGLLDPWYDVDSYADLLYLRGHVSALLLSGQQSLVPRETWKRLSEIVTEPSDH